MTIVKKTENNLNIIIHLHIFIAESMVFSTVYLSNNSSFICFNFPSKNAFLLIQKFFSVFGALETTAKKV